jgi:hypothetical protein
MMNKVTHAVPHKTSENVSEALVEIKNYREKLS